MEHETKIGLSLGEFYLGNFFAYLLGCLSVLLLSLDPAW